MRHDHKSADISYTNIFLSLCPFQFSQRIGTALGKAEIHAQCYIIDTQNQHAPTECANNLHIPPSFSLIVQQRAVKRNEMFVR